MRRRSMIVLAVVATFGAVGLAGCGGDDAEPDTGGQTETEAPDTTEPDDAGETDPPEAGGEGSDEPEDTAETGDSGEGDIAQTIAVEAGDLYFEGIPDTLPAGTIEIEFNNVGEMMHDVTIEELDDTLVVAAAGGETDTNTVTLEPGEYTFYCSVPGHRAQMEVTVTVA